MRKRIGVYICHCGSNIAGYLDVEKVANFAQTLDSVVIARHYMFTCSDPGQEIIKQDIKELKLNRVLVCSCSPTLHLETFRKVCASVGLNPYLCEMATIREYCAWVHSHDNQLATEKAMAIVAAGVRRVSYREPLEIKFAPVNPNTLIVGGGIAGIQAALEIANSEHKIYLVEREPQLGGHMAQIYRTFPNMDSAIETLLPRIEAVASSNYIELMTNSEVIEVSGYIGNFKVKIKKKARFIDESKCDGCGDCWSRCPVTLDSEFDLGLRKRKAIYAVPPGNTAVIDRNHCTHFLDDNCRLCSDACPNKAIDFEKKDEVVEVDAGSIIVATGYDVFQPTAMYQYGYKRFDNVITSLEFERLASLTDGHIVLKDGSTPKSAAIIHCVGSRDMNYHEYCSRVCCMCGLKHAHLLKEKTGADVYQMYIDMRCFGKGHEEFYKRVSEEGVNFIRGKVAQVTDVAINDEEKGKLIVVCEDTLLGALIRVSVELVILNVAMEPRTDIDEVARVFLLGRSADGFFMERHPKLEPIGTMLDGIYAVGCCQGPKDIPDTVAQATGAAAKAIALISKGKVEMEAATACVDEEVCSCCGYCEAACAYSAIAIDLKRRVAVVNEAVCKGCGACTVNCPSKAIQLKNFGLKQILDMLDTATKEYAGLANREH
jgi:heterodisulfide reductase subunit A